MKKEKNKNINKGGKGKKKYTAAEVDSMLDRQKTENEEALRLQKERIFQLKEENARLEEELLEYRKREVAIAKALTFAAQKAAEVEDSARKKYAMEIAHLRLFHDKWKSYYNQLIKKYPIDDKISEIQEFDRKMSRVFGSKDVEESVSLNDSFDKERKRVGSKKKDAPILEDSSADEEDFVPPKTIVDYLEKEGEAEEKRVAAPIKAKGVGLNVLGGKVLSEPIPPSTSGFSFEEALNPKQDLEDIMKDLGLSFEGDL